MKEFILRQIPSLREHGKRYAIILILAQLALIVLLYAGNKNLRDVYSESIEDNVKLFMENYELRMKLQNCAPPEQEQNSPEDPPAGFMKV